MAGILTRKKFKRCEIKLGESAITYRLRRPEFTEQSEIAEAFGGVLSCAAEYEREALIKLAPAEVQARMRQLHAVLRPDLLEVIYRKFVDQVGNLMVEEDDETIVPGTTGLALLKASTEEMIMSVVTELHRMGRLSPEEGKASESPSTSSPVEATPIAGGSDVKSTGVEAGQ